MENMGKRITESIRARHGSAHPRLILTKEKFDFLREQVGSGNLYDLEYQEVKRRADEVLTLPLAVHSTPDGIRIFGQARGDYLSRCQSLGIAYQITGEKQYALRARDELLNFAAFPDWNPYHFLDVGDIAVSLALGYDWVYDCLTPEERKTIRAGFAKNAFLPILDDYHDLPRRRSYRWYHDTPGDNWKYICNGGVSMLAMAIFDEDESGLCEEILDTAFRSNYEFTRAAYHDRDGSYVEGLSYWVYGTMFLAQYQTALMTACGTDFGLTDTAGMRKTGYFPVKLCSNRLVSFNFGDADESNPVHPIFLWIGHTFGQYDISALRINQIRGGKYTLQDLYWLNPDEYVEPSTMDPDFGEIGATNAVFRDTWSVEDGMYAAIHFGDNKAPHAHSDTGTFILEYKGKRFFIDLGRDNYNIKPGYHLCYRHRAEGHNVPVINPSERDGQERRGECYIEAYQAGDVAFASSDMSSCYADGAKVLRELRFDKKAKTVTVTDRLGVKPEDTVFWFAHTPANVVLGADARSAVLEIDGVRLRAEILSPDGHFVTMLPRALPCSPKIESPEAKNPGCKLAIKLTGKANYEIKVAFTPDN